MNLENKPFCAHTSQAQKDFVYIIIFYFWTGVLVMIRKNVMYFLREVQLMQMCCQLMKACTVMATVTVRLAG